MKVEIWKDIENFSKYQVSNLGRIKSKSKMALRIGNYVRTKDDGIQKIVKVTENNCFYRTCTAGFDYHVSLDEDVIGQPSPNIIDLIEVGDYVNGYRVSCISNVTGNVYTDDININFKKNEDIKSIVTKEQFSSMEYRIGE